MSLFWLVSAQAHEFQIHVLEPRDDWCAELHRVASPGDVVQLSDGFYPGGCTVTVGGLVSHNEALVIGAYGSDVTIGADEDGLALAIAAPTVRVWDLDIQGRVEVSADGVNLDSNQIDELVVHPGVAWINVLWNRLWDVDIQVDEVIFRGNLTADAQVYATDGLFADNTVLGDASTDLSCQRNLVTGSLSTSSDTFANVVVGSTVATGRLWGNTLLGPVDANDVRNNLTTVATLDPHQGNLRCDDCLADPSTLDVRPVGLALQAPLVDATEDRFDFCRQPRDFVGAMGTSALASTDVWTAYDRDRSGCASGVYVPPGSPPPPTPPPAPTEPPPTRQPPIELDPLPESSGGCATAPPFFLPWFVVLLLRCRSR